MLVESLILFFFLKDTKQVMSMTFPSCGGLTFNIFSIISFNFISRITNFSARTHFSLHWHLYFFPLKDKNRIFFHDPFKAMLVMVLNGTPRADPCQTKPTTSHCLGAFYLPLCYQRLFCFVAHPLTHHKAKYGPVLPQYGPD